MRRRLALAALATMIGATGTGVSGILAAHADGPLPPIPPACVTQPVGPTQVEVGYCPNGPTPPLVGG
jgi:hypothetical protein